MDSSSADCEKVGPRLVRNSDKSPARIFVRVKGPSSTYKVSDWTGCAGGSFRIPSTSFGGLNPLTGGRDRR